MNNIQFIGVPFDYGVELNNGRPGAKDGPNAIEEELRKHAITKNISWLEVKPLEKDVAGTHERLAGTVEGFVCEGLIPIVVGGGHDISYGSVKGLAQNYSKVGGINFDAHFDVRPVVDGKITSGSPFRRLIDDGLVSGENFVEMGVHAKRNSYEHFLYLMEKGATVISLPEINRKGIDRSLEKALEIASKDTDAIFFDIDIDGIQMAYAPGCSAPGIEEGFTDTQMLKAAYIAGKNEKVKLFNLMEVNPGYDIDNKTVKLSVELILRFMEGVSNRK